MSTELFLALIVFAFVSSATPGPNNLMLMASGANYGFRRSIPHMMGISIGFSIMIVAVGAGLLRLFDTWPVFYSVLKMLSVLYMAWLAWKIATAVPQTASTPGGRPMTFMQAAGFQWVNPKAWAMALTALTVYAPGTTLTAFGLVAVVFGLTNLPAITMWTMIGQQMARYLTRPVHLRIFNLTMAALLMASLWPVLRIGQSTTGAVALP